jgi:hypothetical protein
MTVIALTCFLVVAAAAMSILAKDSVPMAGAAAVSASVVVEGPVSNKQSKSDKLVAAVPAPAAEPVQTAAVPSEPLRSEPVRNEPVRNEPVRSEPLRQAFAAPSPAEIQGLKVASPAPPKPKAKPPAQKPYALLSDAQIASIKERLKLSSAQESYWPPVENALRAVARKIHATRHANPGGTGEIIDPEAEEVQQLKSAAMPLLFQLREDQKREVRSLARLIGLEKVAAAI